MERVPSYLKSALKEPINVAALAVATAATATSAAFGMTADAAFLAVGALVSEAAYLAVVPASNFYRRLVDRRQRARLIAERARQRQELIKTFDPREREAVNYLGWMKGQIASNFRKFARLSEDPPQVQELETAWEAFVDLLDEYRRRKLHLRSIDPQAIANQLKNAERAMALADDETRPLHEKNVSILRRRAQTHHDIKRSIERVEAQLRMIENFFGLVNDQVVTMPGPEYIASLDFDTLLSSIETTREMLQHTAPILSQLDTMSREIPRPRPTLAAERR
jgi:hypothetical protein